MTRDDPRFRSSDAYLAPGGIGGPPDAPEFRRYRRKEFAELRSYVEGEDLTGVSISEANIADGSPKIGDMIARNPKNHDDKWLVTRAYFDENFENL